MSILKYYGFKFKVICAVIWYFKWWILLYVIIFCVIYSLTSSIICIFNSIFSQPDLIGEYFGRIVKGFNSAIK